MTTACAICGVDRSTHGCTQARSGEVYCNGNGNGVPQGWEYIRQRLGGARVYHRIPDPEPPMRPVLLRGDEIKEQAVTWLWQNRLELGALNLVAGDPGSGKSLLTAAISAAVTTGARWPDERLEWTGQPRRVILVTSEDDPAKATVPRLRAAGANLGNIVILRQVEEDGKTRQLCLQRDLLAINAAIREVGDVVLVVIDPVDSYLGKADSNANEEIRHVLEPLVELAEKCGVCMLAVKHLNKSVTANAIYRVAGTVAFVALPRCVHIVGRDPEDKYRKMFVPLKIAHGRRPDALAYEVQQDDEGLPVVAWEADSVDADADDILGSNRKPGPQAAVRNQAVAWLRAALANGPRPSRELLQEASACGYNRWAIDDARKAVGAVALQVRGEGKVSGWAVALPDDGEPHGTP